MMADKENMKETAARQIVEAVQFALSLIHI